MSGKSQLQTTDNFRMSLMFLAPDPLKSPWWVRQFRFSHVAVVIHCPNGGGPLWVIDLQIGNRALAYRAEDYVGMVGRGRRGLMMPTIDVPVSVLADLEALPKYQYIRTFLRHLRLWPKPAVNCTTPALMVLKAAGYDLRGETPDELYEECRRISASEQGFRQRGGRYRGGHDSHLGYAVE